MYRFDTHLVWIISRLSVTVVRFSNAVAFAISAVRVRDVTASSGEDYANNFARQVQFNPGEYEKIWKLELIDDTIYEIKVGPVLIAVHVHTYF